MLPHLLLIPITQFLAVDKSLTSVQAVPFQDSVLAVVLPGGVHLQKLKHEVDVPALC